MGKEQDSSPEPINPVPLFPISKEVAEEAYSTLRIGGNDLRKSLIKKFQDHSPAAYSSMLDLHGKSPRHMDSKSLIASINGAAVCFFVLSMQAEKNGVDLPGITSDTLDARNQTIEEDILRFNKKFEDVVDEDIDMDKKKIADMDDEGIFNATFYLASMRHMYEFYDSEPNLAVLIDQMFGPTLHGNNAKIRFVEIYYLFKEAYESKKFSEGISSWLSQ
ncbi:hypothetical protein M1349_02990 [Patescibacteria group bacterium]|nr:hypothetical protein [Patescibacteria group bacterium]